MNKLKITVETKTLVQALVFANSVVEKRNVIAELNNIKLSSKEGKLEIISTNMEIYLSQKIPAQVINEGEITVSTKTLSDVVKKLSDNEITLQVVDQNDQLEIIGKNCSFSLLTLPVKLFPIIEDINVETAFKMTCRDFIKIIDSTLFAISLDETRYNINGVYFHVKDKECCAVSTDGHRLSVATVEIADNIPEFGVILPKKTLEEIIKILREAKNIQLDVEIFLSSNKIKFVCNEMVMVSKLIDGTFPEYEAFIPQNNNYKLIIDAKLLADVVDRIATITMDKFQAIKLSLSRNVIEIFASGEARGVGREIIQCSTAKENICIYDHDETLSIGFNPKYLTEALNAIISVLKETKVELSFSNPHSPMLLKAVGSSKDLFVIMPVKV